MGLIGSGALLATLPPREVPALTAALGAEGIEVAEIGRITEPGAGLKLRVGGEKRILPRFERDELARWLGE